MFDNKRIPRTLPDIGVYFRMFKNKDCTRIICLLVGFMCEINILIPLEFSSKTICLWCPKKLLRLEGYGYILIIRSKLNISSIDSLW